MERPEVKCAYCGSDGPLTQEHVFSDWIKGEFGRMESQVASLPGKPLQSILKEKDVCAACNNGPLSVLDNYAKSLNLHDPDACRQPFTIQRDRLARYVLKCAYNNARNVRRLADAPTPDMVSTAEAISRFATFIRRGTEQPFPIDLLAAEFTFTKTVAAGSIDIQDSWGCVVFNAILFLGWGCVLIVGWRDGTQEIYRRDIRRGLCEQLNALWVRDENMRLNLKQLTPSAARLPDGTVLPRT